MGVACCVVAGCASRLACRICLRRKETLRGENVEVPDTFTRKEYLSVAASLDIKPKTAEKYIGQMKDGGMLEHGFNKYMKRGGG